MIQPPKSWNQGGAYWRNIMSHPLAQNNSISCFHTAFRLARVSLSLSNDPPWKGLWRLLQNNYVSDGHPQEALQEHQLVDAVKANTFPIQLLVPLFEAPMPFLYISQFSYKQFISWVKFISNFFLVTRNIHWNRKCSSTSYVFSKLESFPTSPSPFT